MSKKVLILTAILLFFSVCELQAAITHSTWVGGEQSEWGRASNWDPARVPDNNSWRTFVFTKDINSIGVDEVEVRLQQNRTIDRLDCYGEVTLQKWTSGRAELTIYDGLINHGYLEISDLNIRANITNTTEAMLNLSDIEEINGNLYNHVEATIIIEYEVDIYGDLENVGLIEIVPNTYEFYVDQHLHNTGQINVYGGLFGVGEVLHNDSSGIIKGFGVVHAEQLVRNKGQIIAFGGSLVVASEGTLTNTGLLRNDPLASLQIKPSMHTEPAEDVNNLGTIEVNAGGGVAFDCNLVNKPNAIIKLLGGTLAANTITQSAGAIFEGFGGITGNVMINPNGLIELAGPTNIVGDVTVEHNAVLEISDGQTLIVGHTTNNGEIRVVNGKVVFQGGYSGSGIVKKE